jgi:hypothetical protein
MWRNSQYQILETPSTADAQAKISDGKVVPLQVFSMMIHILYTSNFNHLMDMFRGL